MLLSNSFRDSGNPLRVWGSANPAGERNNYGRTGALRNFELGEAKIASVSDRQGIPAGARHPVAFLMPSKPGGMSSRFNSAGEAIVTGSGARGINLGGTSIGDAAGVGTGQLIVSGSGTAVGESSGSGTILAALVGAGTSAGLSDGQGTLRATGHAEALGSGQATVSAVIRATGLLTGASDVSSQGALTSAAISSDILDSQLVESGLTVRKALRLISAALAGKVSGAAGSSITFRAANADHKDRIVATVDASGNRSAVTLDLEG